MQSTLRVDAALYGSALLVDRMLAFFLLPLLTRAISPSDYGLWTQTAIAAGMLMPVVLFGFATAIVRFFSGAVSVIAKRRYFFILATLCLVLFVVCVILANQLAEPFSRFIYGEGGLSALVPILLTLLAADAITDYAIAWLRASARMAAVAVALMLRSAVRYGAVLALVSGASVPITVWLSQYCAFQLALALLIVVGSAWSVLRMPPLIESIEAPRLFELLRFSMPLVLLAVLTSANAFLDRFLLVNLLGLESVAIYAAAISLCTIPAAFYGVLGFTLFPELSRRWQEKRLEEVARLMSLALKVFLFCCLPVSALLALSGSWLLPLIATSEYVAAPLVFVFLGISVVAMGIYQILLYALLLDGRGAQMIFLSATAVVLNFVLNLLLIGPIGITGAAAAAATSNWFMVGLVIRLTQSVLPNWTFPWSSIWALSWRVAAASLPLVVLGLFAPFPAIAGAATAVLSLVSYLVLDWMRAGSIARSVIVQRVT